MFTTAMIFAAGRGERLRPITDSYPKALCCVRGVTLIENHIIKLTQAGFKHIVINHAYLGWKIRQCVGNGSRFGIKISYSPEPPGALETGGGLVNALPLLGNQPFITINADIFTDFNFANLSLPCSSLVHLVLVKKPDYFSVADFGLRGGLITNHDRQYTFAGIACYRPDVFNESHMGRYSITPLLRNLAEKNQVSGESYPGIWFDIGTPERLARVAIAGF